MSGRRILLPQDFNSFLCKGFLKRERYFFQEEMKSALFFLLKRIVKQKFIKNIGIFCRLNKNHPIKLKK